MINDLKLKKAIFLDRDGVINYDSPEYIKNIDEVRLIPDIVTNLKKIRDYGFKLFIVSNQSAVGRGIISQLELEQINSFIISTLEKENCKIDGLYFCPHSPDENCQCRKPSPNMIFQAAKQHQIDLINSWMIGDKTSDMEAGKNAGCKTYQIKTNSSISDALNFIVKSI